MNKLDTFRCWASTVPFSLLVLGTSFLFPSITREFMAPKMSPRFPCFACVSTATLSYPTTALWLLPYPPGYFSYQKFPLILPNWLIFLPLNTSVIIFVSQSWPLHAAILHSYWWNCVTSPVGAENSQRMRFFIFCLLSHHRWKHSLGPTVVTH